MDNTTVEFTAFGFVRYDENDCAVLSIVDKVQGLIATKTLGYYEHIATALKEMARDNGYGIVSPEMMELTDSVSAGYYQLVERSM